MNGGSKILTVSYGAFSCTLEGFDDPFAAMKAIAEYCRDLAAEDRLFGAEPPQPDPDQLHRIAEAALNQRVEARPGNGTVILRAAADPAKGDGRAEQPAPQEPVPAQTPPAARIDPAATEGATHGPDLAAPPDRPAPIFGEPAADKAALAVARALATPASDPPGPDGHSTPDSRPQTLTPPAAIASDVLPEDVRDTPADLRPEDAADTAADWMPEDTAGDLSDAEEAALLAALEAPDETAAPHPADDAGLRALIARAQAEQTAEDACDLSERLERARARVVRIKPEDAPGAGGAPARRPDGTASRQLAEATSEDAVERILDKASSEMRAPESRRRMSALAHLKAAVAATVAERLSGGHNHDGAAARLGAYRDDLARVVRPGTGAERTAPLMLVSEQRIDRPQADVAPPPAAMVAAPEDEDEDDDDPEDGAPIAEPGAFSAFVRRLGSQDLPELIEAAAAFSELVEGRPHVTRPHLMRYVACVAPEGTFSREAAMRSFGILLREGRLEKVRRGQFALAQGTETRATALRMLGASRTRPMA